MLLKSEKYWATMRCWSISSSMKILARQYSGSKWQGARHHSQDQALELPTSQSLEPSQADQLWLKSEPKVRLWRLLGQETPSRLQGSGFLAVTKIQVPQVAWQSHMFVWLWSNIRPKVRLCKVLGKVTRSRLWLKKSPNVKLCRLVAKVTRSRDKIARFSNSLAFGGVQDSGSTSHRELNLPDCPAASRGRDSDWTSNQGQDIAACLGRSLSQGSDQRHRQKSSLSDRFDDRSRVRLTLIKPVVKS